VVLEESPGWAKVRTPDQYGALKAVKHLSDWKSVSRPHRELSAAARRKIAAARRARWARLRKQRAVGNLGLTAGFVPSARNSDRTKEKLPRQKRSASAYCPSFRRIGRRGCRRNFLSDEVILNAPNARIPNARVPKPETRGKFEKTDGFLCC